MHVIISATVFAAAVIASSATATTLRSESVETVDAASRVLTANITSLSINRGTGKQRCGSMWSDGFDDVKYACEWDHSHWWDNSYNLFFMRFDGSWVKECDCDKGLDLYNPWGTRWTISHIYDTAITCATRDGKTAEQVKSVFDNISC